MKKNILRWAETAAYCMAIILRYTFPSKWRYLVGDIVRKTFSQQILRLLNERFFPVLFDGCKIESEVDYLTLECYVPLKLNLDLSDGTEAGFWLAAEPVLSGYLERVLDSSAVFVDVGANFGFYSLLASIRCNAKAIICIEPNPTTFDRLKKNIEKNKINARLFNLGLSDKNEDAELHEFPLNRGGSSINSKNTERRVLERWEQKMFGKADYSKIHKIECVSFDDLIQTGDIKDIMNEEKIVIKIDAEGHDTNILMGMHQFIDSYKGKLVLIVEAYRPEQEHMEDLLSRHGFKKYYIDGTKGILTENVVYLEANYDDLVFLRNSTLSE